METETLGISIFNQTTIMDEVDDLYIALTGDQCALTDIHLVRECVVEVEKMRNRMQQ